MLESISNTAAREVLRGHSGLHVRQPTVMHGSGGYIVTGYRVDDDCCCSQGKLLDALSIPATNEAEVSAYLTRNKIPSGAVFSWNNAWRQATNEGFSDYTNTIHAGLLLFVPSTITH